MFKAKITEINKRKIQENKAVRNIKEKRAKEIERGQREVILERSSREVIYKPKALPMCTSTPRMLIIGKTIVY